MKVKEAIALLPSVPFGLPAFPDLTFDIDERASFTNDSGVQLVVRRTDTGEHFARESVSQVLKLAMKL